MLLLSRLLAGLALLLTVPLAAPRALAQPTGAELVTSALRPFGLAADTQGHLWVAESGTGTDTNDGRISVVLPDGQTFPFLTGIATGGTAAEPRGISHLALLGDDLWFTRTTSNSAGFLCRISTAGFTPGDSPHTSADIATTVEVGAFVFAQGFTDSNAYGLTVGPDGALYLTDAGANLVLRYEPTAGALSVVAVFPDLPNPSGVGPPFVNVVPTGIVAADGRLYVAALTGFPFATGLARVYAVELDGTVRVHRGALTALDDLAYDPLTGTLTALQYATFGFSPPPPAWRPGTGRAIRLDDGLELAAGFDFAAGAAYAADGTLYVSTLTGNLYRVAAHPVVDEPAPAVGGLALHAARPNPAAGTTTLGYDLTAAGHVRLAVIDLLGREVAVLVDGSLEAGTHDVAFDAGRLAPGLYVVRLDANGATQSRRLVVAR